MELNGTPHENSVILDCQKFSQADNDLLDFFSFWVEGVLTTIVAILGQKLLKNAKNRKFQILMLPDVAFHKNSQILSILLAFLSNFWQNHIW